MQMSSASNNIAANRKALNFYQKAFNVKDRFVDRREFVNAVTNDNITVVKMWQERMLSFYWWSLRAMKFCAETSFVHRTESSYDLKIANIMSFNSIDV